jgi:putative flippase GtrA
VRKTLRHPVASARVWIHTPQAGRFFRYSMVSVVSTVVSLGGLYFFFRVVKIGTATESNLLATSIASIPAYYLNRTWSWGKTGRSHVMREVVPFWTITAIGILLSSGAVHLATVSAHNAHLGHRGVTLVVEGANFATYGILWVGKFLVFNRYLFRVDDTIASPVSESGIDVALLPPSNGARAGEQPAAVAAVNTAADEAVSAADFS